MTRISDEAEVCAYSFPRPHSGSWNPLSCSGRPVKSEKKNAKIFRGGPGKGGTPQEYFGNKMNFAGAPWGVMRVAALLDCRGGSRRGIRGRRRCGSFVSVLVGLISECVVFCGHGCVDQ